ncbi:MAG: winged helix-turn-helix transcriptional regulator [Sphaerochaetaceae bacterium]|nr:winged helix-turn-helix transcriptional regulator [Sphaerochaetaceae bacterium]
MNTHRSAGHSIASINRLATVYFNEALSNLGLRGPGQVRLLLTLNTCSDGVTQEELAQYMLIDKASISRMIRPLLERKIVIRSRDRRDRRAYRVYLSDAWKERMEEVHEKARAWTEILMQGFTPTEREECFSYLDRMFQNATDHTKGYQHGTQEG